MIRSVEFDLETKRERNQRGASIGAVMALADRVKRQRAATREVLMQRFGAHVPPLSVVINGVVHPNEIVVRLTRISPGTLDSDGPDDALKNVRDEVAAWIGVDDRDPIVTWPRGEQEKGAPNVYRVRIEIADLMPGEPRVIICAAKDVVHRETGARVRKAIRAEEKRRAGGVVQTGRVLSYQPDAAARGASSAARGKAEAAFAKVTGKPTALDLRDAAERVLERGGGANGGKGGQTERKAAGSSLNGVVEHRVPSQGPPRALPDRDPGDEAPARDLADCETCGAKVPTPCKLDVGGRVVFGVHVARARAAGLHVPEDDRAHVRPAREPRPMAPETRCGRCGWPLREHVGGMRTCPGSGGLALRFFEPAASGETKARRLATVPGQARLALWRSWAALPWEQTPCPACEGRGALIGVNPGALASACTVCKGRGRKGHRLVHLARFDGTAEPPATVTHPVPAEHQAAHGLEVTLHRRTFKSSSTGSCWLYDTTTTPTKGD